MTGQMTSSDNLSAPQSRLPLIDALRAVAATLITWHHIDLYGPLSHVATPSWISDVAWNLSCAVQVFFVIGGYIMARTMSSRPWNCRDAGRFVARRYCRLVLPFLAAMVLAIAARAAGRGWLPERVVDHPATWDQVLAHFVLLQDILGYQSLSAGFWFVAIDFQLGLIYVALLCLREFVPWRSGGGAGERANWLLVATGCVLAAAAMFVFNLDSRLDVWAIYFFGQFFMGVMVYEGLKSRGSAILFGLYVALTAAALALAWRWQLATALAIAVVLFSASKLALMERWPRNRLIARLGLTSYSLFLVHFPVLVFVSTIWSRLGYSTVTSAVVASVAAYVASLAAAELFYRLVETPAVALATRSGRSRLARVPLATRESGSPV
jgi:peptidoglycan/LPS O-acetylase OafA/YrhL